MISFPIPEKKEIQKRAFTLRNNLQYIHWSSSGVHDKKSSHLFQAYLRHKTFLEIADKFLEILTANQPDFEKAGNLSVDLVIRGSLISLSVADRAQHHELSKFIDNIKLFAKNFEDRVESLIVLPEETKLLPKYIPASISEIERLFITAQDAFVPRDETPSSLKTNSDKKFYSLYWPMKLFLLSYEIQELESDRSRIAPVGANLIDCVNISISQAEDYLKGLDLEAKDARAHANTISKRVKDASNVIGGLNFPPYSLFSSAQILAELIAERIDTNRKPSISLQEAILVDKDCEFPLTPLFFAQEDKRRPGPV